MRYEAVKVKQFEDGPEVVLFSAPATEIAAWSGIPQRRRIQTSDGAVETAGFQREERSSRVADLAAFMRNPSNVIQNPLLAAVQEHESVKVVEDEHGRFFIEINPVSLCERTLLQLLEAAAGDLQDRLPELLARTVDGAALAQLRSILSTPIVEEPFAPDEATDEATEEEQVLDLESGPEAEVGLLEYETQVVEFYDEIKLRIAVLKELGAAADGLTEIAGFSRDFLESLLQPVVLVDGQHRLRGALRAVEELEQTSEGATRIAQLVDEGHPAEEALHRFRLESGRHLPVSMLMSAEPAEHVFQFVVVNQKATPMSGALLGTIVSTSLTQSELEPIRARLQDAGIELEGSRAVAYLSRAPESPFSGLVMTGLGGDRANALPWSVLGKLVDTVRYLHSGALYSQPGIDNAKLWRDGKFQASALVDSSLTGAQRLDAWSQVDGPWRQLFIKLHSTIRDRFGDTDDMTAANAWGSTRSNLFNMVSLATLQADFFDYIRDRKLDTWDEVDVAIGDWLQDLKSDYFARDWRMGGTKKDQPAIKKAWAEAWHEYRVTKRRPRVERYNPGSGRG